MMDLEDEVPVSLHVEPPLISIVEAGFDDKVRAAQLAVYSV